MRYTPTRCRRRPIPPDARQGQPGPGHRRRRPRVAAGARNVHIAFSSFAGAFYRMMSEPKSHQVNACPTEQPADPEPRAGLADHRHHPDPALPQTARAVREALDGMARLLDESRMQGPAPVLPTQFDTDGEQAALAYPLKQMIKASHMIRQELLALDEPAHAPGGGAGLSGRRVPRIATPENGRPEGGHFHDNQRLRACAGTPACRPARPTRRRRNPPGRSPCSPSGLATLCRMA